MSNNITRFRVKQKPWLAVGVAAPRVAAERVDAPRVAAEGVIESVGGDGCGQQCFRDFDMLLHTRSPPSTSIEK